MVQTTMEMLKGLAQLKNAAGYEAFMSWLKNSHSSIVEQFHHAPDTELPGLKYQASLLREIIKTIETAPETIRRAEHKEI